MNSVNISGRLGEDCIIKATRNGGKILTNSLAVDIRTKGGKNTEWHRIVAFGKTAELLERWFKKGSPIGITGTLRAREYTDKDTGQKRYATEIYVDEVTFWGGKSPEGVTDQRGSTNAFESGAFENLDPLDAGDLPF